MPCSGKVNLPPDVAEPTIFEADPAIFEADPAIFEADPSPTRYKSKDVLRYCIRMFFIGPG